MSNLTTRIDVTKTPFTKYGSWISITSASNTGPLKIVNVREIFGKDQAMMFEFHKDGKSITHATEATPAVLKATTYAGDVRIYMKGRDGVVFESTGPDIVFRALKSQWGKYRPRVQPEMPYAMEHSSDDRKVIDIMFDNFAVFDIIQGKATENSDALVISPDGGKAVVLFRIAKSMPEGCPKIDVESDVASLEAEWAEFLAKMPEAPADRRAEAEQAWHVLFSNIVCAEGNLKYDTMFVNKDYMTAVWSWDHCFHALGLAKGDFKAGWEQFVAPFERQDETGKMPDLWKAPDIEFWGITKPPVHGWCLFKLMELGDVDREKLEYIYPRLEKWTNYWFNERDDDGDGIPNYTEDGCDSGMDNSTVYDVGGKLETPDLSSYLVMQMKALAVVARKLGDEEAAKTWDARAEKLLADMYDHFWKGERFVCVKNETHEFDPEPTASLPLMPLMLGDYLDKDKFDKCVVELEERFLTDYGIASEDPKSPKYTPDSYWRGPIWAPQVYLTVDGLRRGGREELAKEIAARYCDMIKYQAGGNYENFDPKMGKGNRQTGFSWSAAVNLLLMWEYLV